MHAQKTYRDEQSRLHDPHPHRHQNGKNIHGRSNHVFSSALVHVVPVYTLSEENVRHKYSYYFVVHNFSMQWVHATYSLKMDRRNACVITYFGDGGLSEVKY
jgi:hypothetical protein